MIALNDLSFGYKSPILSDVNFTFEDNKIYGILAHSGYGKTTLLKTICGLIKPLRGTVEIDGVKYKDAYTNPVYMMHQRYTNFGWKDCLENVLIGRRDKAVRDEEEAKRILDSVGLWSNENVYPTQLSGGMQQRLALARMLYAHPKHLLMDEPLSALDDATRRDMQQLIIDHHNQTHNTIIMVTHSKKEADVMCDQIIKLEDFNGNLRKIRIDRSR